jgi:tetratricopeptide (TPR) repeat protein
MEMPMSSNPNTVKPHRRRHRPQLDAVLIQLSSQRPSNVWRGMEQARQWLKEDAEDSDVYGLLLDAVQKNRELREQVRNLLDEMMRNGSQSAEKAILALPSSLEDFLADADDAYYGADYERAITLYRQVLKLDPENARAKDHTAKAEIKRITGEPASGLPRVAEQYYRRARSYIAARDVVTAMNLLNAAIEAAQAKNIKYSDAEEALSNMNNLLLADDFRQKAKTALNENRWKDALESCEKALTLDPTNELTKKELESLQDLLKAETALKKRGIMKILMPINQLQNTVESARIIMNSDNPLLNFIEQQLARIRFYRIAGIVLLLVIIVFPIYIIQILKVPLSAVFTNTPTIPYTMTITPKVISTNTAQQETETVVATSIEVMDTNTPQPTPTEALTSIPTETILGVGNINMGTVNIFEAPNGKVIERLTLNTPLKILKEYKDKSGLTWYRCRWDSNGVSTEGWIIADYITIGTPRP